MNERRKSQVVVAHGPKNVRSGKTVAVRRVRICTDGAEWWWEYTRGSTFVCAGKRYRRVSDASYNAQLFANDLVDTVGCTILYPDDYTPSHGWDGEPGTDKYD